MSLEIEPSEKTSFFYKFSNFEGGGTFHVFRPSGAADDTCMIDWKPKLVMIRFDFHFLQHNQWRKQGGLGGVQTPQPEKMLQKNDVIREILIFSNKISQKIDKTAIFN